MKTRLFNIAIFILGMVLAAACTPSASPIPDIDATPTPVPDTDDPGAIVHAFEEALNSGDVEAAAALFADEAVVTFVPDDVTSGAEAIHDWLEQLIAYNFEIEYEILDESGNQVVAETTSWSDFSRGLGVAPLIAKEVYAIQDGKIQDLTVTLTGESEAKLQAALAALPSSVVAAFEEALNSGNVEAAAGLFANDAVVTFVPDDVTSGAEEIHTWLEQLIAFNFAIEYELLDESDMQVVAQTTSWSDFSRGLGVAPLIAEEVYTVQDGKIQDLTVTLTDESEVKLQAALAALPSNTILALSQAINAGDLDAAMDMYDSNLYFEFTPAMQPGFPNISGNKEDMRAWLENMNSENVQLEIEILSETGDEVTTKCKMSSDYLRSLGVSPTVLTDKVKVQNGKIGSYISTLSPTSLNTLQEGLAKSRLSSKIAPEPGEAMLNIASELEGKWLGYMGGEAGYLIFEQGGKFKITEDTGQVGERGRYWFENQVLILETEAPNLYCDKGHGSYLIYTKSSTTKPEQLRFSRILDLCQLRSWFLTEAPFTLEH